MEKTGENHVFLSCNCDTTAFYFWLRSMIIKISIRESKRRVLGGVWYLVEQSKASTLVIRALRKPHSLVSRHGAIPQLRPDPVQ